MALYSYTARNSRCELITGNITADSIEIASKLLRAESKYVVDISAGLNSGDNKLADEIRLNQSAKRIKPQEVIDYCHQLSVMLDTGVPLGQALEAINEQGKPTDFKKISETVTEEVTTGESLSSALERWPGVFPNLMVCLVKASEVSGTMGLMLGRVSNYLGKELKTKKQIKGAMTYPCIMMVLALAITVFLMTVVLPRFAAIYASRSAALPVPTQIMMSISGCLTGHWLVCSVSSVALILGTLTFVKKPIGRKFLDWLRLNIPVVKIMYRKLYIARSSRTMATLLLSGVDLMEAIKITAGVTDNIYFKNMWKNVSKELESGKRFCEAISRSDLIPTSIVQMLAAGEHSGRLGQVMERVGEVSEMELDEAVSNVTQYIEPIMISVMGIIIGFVAISLLLPIFTISNIMH